MSIQRTPYPRSCTRGHYMVFCVLIAVGQSPHSTRTRMKRIGFLVLVLLLPATAETQFLSEIDVGLNLRSTTHLTERYRNLYQPADHLNVSMQTPFHVGYLQANLRYVNTTGKNGITDYRHINAELFWLAGIPLTPSLKLYGGIGTGAEIYLIEVWDSSTDETEILFGLKSELQYSWRNLVFFTDVSLTRVHIYHKMDYISFGAGVRYRFRLPEEVLDVVR